MLAELPKKAERKVIAWRIYENIKYEICKTETYISIYLQYRMSYFWKKLCLNIESARSHARFVWKKMNQHGAFQTVVYCYRCLESVRFGCSTEYTALLPGFCFCLLKIYHAPGEHVTSLITCLLSIEITELQRPN